MKFTDVSCVQPFKKRFGMFSTFPLTVTVFSDVHPKNIPTPIAPLTVALVILIQFLNTSCDTIPVVTLSDIIPVLENARGLKLISFAGNTTDVNDVQSENAFDPMPMTDSGIDMFYNDLH